jgi:hypothetical protein
MPHRSLKVVDSDRPPADLVRRAKAAFTHRGHGAVAALVHDSLLDEGAPVADHLLRFEHADLLVEARLAIESHDARLAGHVSPSMSGPVQLQSASGDVLVVNMVDGEFAFTGIHHGIIRLHLFGDRYRTDVRTDWFQI